MPLASPNKTGRKKSKRWILLLDYSNRGGCGMSVILKGCNFEQIKLSIHF